MGMDRKMKEIKNENIANRGEKITQNKALTLRASGINEFITYGIILLICIIMCSPLLQFHIASDTYNLMDLGYFEYPSHYFLKDARIVSTLVMYLAGILNLSYEFFIVFMEVLAVIITSLSIYYIYKTVKEKINLETNWKKALVIMATFILIFNCMSLEYLLYAECSVMCLSVFLSVISARIFSKNKKHHFIVPTLLMIIATFCYQGSVNIFLPLVVLFLFIDKKKLGNKELVKQIIIASIVLGIAYLINVVSIYAINIALGEVQGRISNGVLSNLSIFGYVLGIILRATLITNYNLWPTGITLIFIFIILFQEKTNEKLFKYLILVIISIGICIVPVFFLSSPSMEPRMAMSIGSIIGMTLIYLLSLEQKHKSLEYAVSIIVIGFFIFNTINTIQIYSAHIAGNKIDENMGMTIKYRIEEYERESGNTVTSVAYYRDANHRDYHLGWDKKLSSFGQRAFDNYYCIVEALNYFCERKFERVQMDAEIYNEYFAGKDWDAYSDEQIVFDGDTMYLCTY